MEVDPREKNNLKSAELKTGSKHGPILHEIIDNPGSCIVNHQMNGNTRIKMLSICPNDEQKLICFDIKDDCTVQDLLDEAGIPMCRDLEIYHIKNDPGLDFDYVVKSVALFEEGNKGSDKDNLKAIKGKKEAQENKDNLNESSMTAENSSGFFSSLDENCSNLSMTENKELEKKKTNKETRELLEAEGDRDRAGPSKIGRNQNRRTAKPMVCKYLEGLLDTSSDEEDQIKKKSEKFKVENNSPVVTDLDNTHDEIETEIILEKESAITHSNSTPHTSLNCSIVIIGSYNYTPQERVIISQSGVRLRTPLINDDTNFVEWELKFKAILKLAVYFGEAMSVLFFYPHPSVVGMIRERLGMQDRKGPFYDPFCRDNKKKRIILLLEDINEESKLTLIELFSPNEILGYLSNEEAAALLLQSSPSNFRPHLNNLLKKKKPASSMVQNTVNGGVKMIVDEAQNQMQISKEKKPTISNNVNREIKPVFKTPNTSLKRPRELESTVNNSVHDNSETLLVYPSTPASGGITITAQDLACLRESNFLNDIIIDFYLQYLNRQVLSEEDRDRTHCFSIHFYTRLTSQANDNNTSLTAAKRHSNVSKWTKNVNIFEKDFIIIPINENAHWFLAIICFPGLVGKVQTAVETSEIQKNKYNLRKAKEMKQSTTKRDKKGVRRLPCILIFDSLIGSVNRARPVIEVLRDYLSCEHLDKLGTEKIFSADTIKASCPKVPQQNNFSDCGLYLLQYVESFFSDPITDYNLPIKTLEDWFEESVVIRKRQKLTNLISKLIKSS